MKATTIIEAAALLVGGDRAKQHGDMEKTHDDVAALWTAYTGVSLTGQDVAMMMVLLKIGRAKNGAFNLDDYVDMAGYSGIAGQLAHND